MKIDIFFIKKKNIISIFIEFIKITIIIYIKLLLKIIKLLYFL